MQFEWDPKKAESNRKKHGIAFEVAATIFGDPLAITFNDPDHSDDEFRRLTFGLSESGHLLVVAHTDRASKIRIISARVAGKAERRIYEEG